MWTLLLTLPLVAAADLELPPTRRRGRRLHAQAAPRGVDGAPAEEGQDHLLALAQEALVVHYPRTPFSRSGVFMTFSTHAVCPKAVAVGASMIALSTRGTW